MHDKQIRREIENTLGFFPPFLEPAEATPPLLSSLWQQILALYINNPLPALFKEQLIAYLSLYCTHPYALISHCCALREMGLSAAKIRALLTQAPPNGPELSGHVQTLSDTGAITIWPEPDEAFNLAAQRCAVAIFLGNTHAGQCIQALRSSLGSIYYNELVTFLGHIKNYHLWLETHPDLDYTQDLRVSQHLASLIQDPRLRDILLTPRNMPNHQTQGDEDCETRCQTIIETLADPVCMMDLQGNLLKANPAFEKIYGWSPENPPETLHSITTDDLLQDYQGLFERVIAGETITDHEMIRRRSDGRLIDVRLTLSPVRNHQGEVAAIIDISRDISAYKAHLTMLEYKSLHDPLTDLPNRALFYNRVNQSLSLSRREDRDLAVIMMDLDHFKDINDTLGHHSGDMLLRQVGMRIQGLLRESDTVARMGGDEFAILLNSAGEPIPPENMAEKILAGLETPFIIDGIPFQVGASIGIAIHPQHGYNAELLIQNADMAMYTAKRSRETYAIYNPESPSSHASLLSELRLAIEKNQLELYYQPKIDLKSGRMIGAEALLRWQHPILGVLQPGQFIPLAERAGLTKPLTLWVIDNALKQSRIWHDEGLCFPVAINLATENLQDPELADCITERLGAYDLPFSALALEVREGAIMPSPQRISKNLRRLSQLGIRLSLDDFGTGPSSLLFLKNLPIHEIKIDRPFVSDMTHQAEIIQSIIDMGHHLHMQITAEGVESAATQDQLTAMGCDAAQGYWIGAPTPAMHITKNKYQ